MPLPSSIWVKFKDDQIKVTYLGVEYTLTYGQAVLGSDPLFYYWLDGDATNGHVLTASGPGTSDVLPDLSGTNTLGVSLSTWVDETGTDVSLGSIGYTDWSVTSVSGSITAATIIHRDPRLPKLLQLQNANYDQGDYYFYATWNEENTVAIEYDHLLLESPNPKFRVYIGGGEWPNQTDYSFSLDANNVGTTDCPFVEWIGELATVETFTPFDSGTWVPPADIDTSKPVIVECWGAGGNGGTDSSGTGAVGGGGGGYASCDFCAIIFDYEWKIWSDHAPPGQSASYLGDVEELYSPPALAYSADDTGHGGGASGFGDVRFSGGDGGPAGLTSGGGGGGQGAAPFADGQDAVDENGYNGWDSTLLLGASGNGSVAGMVAATNGSVPGGGGGGGMSGFGNEVGGLGANGLVKIHYSLSIIVPTPEPEITTAEGSRKTISIVRNTNIIGNTTIPEGSTIKRLGGSGGVSTAGPKHGQQEFIELPEENLS